MKASIVSAMGFYVFYMWGLAVLNFRGRLGAIKSGNVKLSYFRTMAGPGEVPEHVVTRTRHFDNQFQVPLVFFMTCLTFLILGIQTQVALVMPWVFVATRLAHSFVHLGSNNVRHRVLAYAAGWISILIMWVHILYDSI